MALSAHEDNEHRRDILLRDFLAVREATETLARPLAIEDYGMQAMEDVSPTKWHLAHTSWFFETFILEVYATDYEPFHPEFRRLFNSYYESVGTFWPRPLRGLLSRPTVEEVYRYRHFVEEHMRRFIQTTGPGEMDAAWPVIVLGLNHEQQHQELLLTDIQYNLSINPLNPAYTQLKPLEGSRSGESRWISYEGGLVTIGYQADGFCFDNERPAHRQWLEPFRIRDRLVTNREYLEFMLDGGYTTPTLWLSEGWQHIRSDGWRAPLYWQELDGEWRRFTLGGLKPVDWEAPVAHVSYFEADAFARWAGKRLCREGEWEAASAGQDPKVGNLLEDGMFRPVPAPDADGPLQMFGDVWEWTQSAYAPYPGYRPELGALGEYNGKFMSSQQVLRGGSCVTPRSHIRRTYRNFFPPQARWQFAGIRLAEDASD